MTTPAYDAVVIGAGAAGLHCAAIAGQRGLRILVIDHAERVAEKIRISGGGRCNFTNREVGPANFLSANPDFCRSALVRYAPADFIALLGRHGVRWHEKARGQLFCDERSEHVIEVLLAECGAGRVERWQPCEILAVRHANGFELDTSRGTVRARRLVVATGGLSIPKIGASDFGLRLARQFGLGVVPTRPALVPLVFDPAGWSRFATLSGVALPVSIEAGAGPRRGAFVDDLLFTHRGLSGPAALQISSYWAPGDAIRIDLLPSADLAAHLRQAKRTSRKRLAAELAALLPNRLVDAWLASAVPAWNDRPLAEQRDADLDRLTAGLQRWEARPQSTEGYRKAEVTGGGVDTRELHSQTFESRRMPGLHFIGEVVDVTGWLGGYNFQWAWASAAACARSLPLSAEPVVG